MITTGVLGDLYDFVHQSIMENQFSQGAFVMGVLTAAWQIVRRWPISVYNRAYRHMNYSVSIEQIDKIYDFMNRMIDDEWPNKGRIMEAATQQFYVDGVGDDKVKVFPYKDYFYTWYRNRLIRITKSREKLSTMNREESYMGTIEISGILAKKQIDHLVKSLYDYDIKKDESISKYTVDSMGYWSRSDFKFFKKMSNLYFPEKKSLLDRVDLFAKSKDLYKKRGIEWSLGILLYGIPGCGKTSFAIALAEYTGRDLYIINLSGINCAGYIRAFGDIGENAIVLMDDVDIGIPKRDSKEDAKKDLLREVLSSLSGSSSRDDIIIVMTTNDRSQLDEALIRKGRVDVIEEVSPPDNRNISEYICMFYDKDISFESEYKINLSMVDVQDICLNSDSAEEAVDKIKNYELRTINV